MMPPARVATRRSLVPQHRLAALTAIIGIGAIGRQVPLQVAAMDPLRWIP